MKKGEVSTFTLSPEYAYGEAGSPPTIPPNSPLVFEVELVSWKSVKDIVGDGGVIKTVIKEGEGWGNPRDRDEVTVDYTVRVIGSNNTSSLSEGTAPLLTAVGVIFSLNKGQLCPGITTALKTMKKGEEVKLIIKPEYAFKNTAPPDALVQQLPQQHSLDISEATLEIHMTLHKWNKVEDITDDGCVFKKTVQESAEWQTPNMGSVVKIVYIGRVVDGKGNGEVFDDQHSSENTALEYTVEEGEVPEGLDLGVMKMKEGEKAVITITDPRYFRYEDGSSTKIKPVPMLIESSAIIEYEVKLHTMTRSKEAWDMDTVEEKLLAAGSGKDKGNVLFKRGKYAKAVKHYNRAMGYIEFDDNYEAEEKIKSNEIKKSLNLNLAVCYLKLGDWIETEKAASKVLEKDAGNSKALFRRAQGYIGSGDFIEAEMDIKRGLAQEEEEEESEGGGEKKKKKKDVSDFKVLYKQWKVKSAAATKKEAKTWVNAFAKMAKIEGEREEERLVVGGGEGEVNAATVTEA